MLAVSYFHPTPPPSVIAFILKVYSIDMVVLATSAGLGTVVSI